MLHVFVVVRRIILGTFCVVRVEASWAACFFVFLETADVPPRSLVLKHASWSGSGPREMKTTQTPSCLLLVIRCGRTDPFAILCALEVSQYQRAAIAKIYKMTLTHGHTGWVLRKRDNFIFFCQ